MKKIATRALLAVLLVAGASSAQAPKLSGSEVDGRARFEEGVKLAQGGDHERARLKFVQAWALLKYSSVLFNLARAEQLSGHTVDALRHYRQFSKSTDPKITPAQREMADTNVAELSKSVGQIAIEAPPGAGVTVDGERIDGELTEPIPVTPGAHVVEATQDGKTKHVSVDCTAGTTARASLVEQAPVAAPTPVAPASVVASSAPTDEREQRSLVLPTALAVAGLAGIGVGVGFSLASHSAKTDAENLGKPFVCVDRSTPACTSYVDAHDRVHSDATIAWVGYIAGGVLLAGAVGTYLFWPKQKKTAMRVVPIVGPGTAAAMATYAF